MSTLNLVSTFARLAWPTHVNITCWFFVFNNSTSLFQHVNLNLKKTWMTSRIHSQTHVLAHSMGVYPQTSRISQLLSPNNKLMKLPQEIIFAWALVPFESYLLKRMSPCTQPDTYQNLMMQLLSNKVIWYIVWSKLPKSEDHSGLESQFHYYSLI